MKFCVYRLSKHPVATTFLAVVVARPMAVSPTIYVSLKLNEGKKHRSHFFLAEAGTEHMQMLHDFTVQKRGTIFFLFLLLLQCVQCLNVSAVGHIVPHSPAKLCIAQKIKEEKKTIIINENAKINERKRGKKSATTSYLLWAY